MNERIRELGDLADELANEQIDCIGEYHPDWHSVRDQKFAELIVAECATVADHWVMFDEGPLTYGPVGEKIKQHFGVEE